MMKERPAVWKMVREIRLVGGQGLAQLCEHLLRELLAALPIVDGHTNESRVTSTPRVELGAILGDGPVGQLAAGWPPTRDFGTMVPEIVPNGVSFNYVLI